MAKKYKLLYLGETYSIVNYYNHSYTEFRSVYHYNFYIIYFDRTSLFDMKHLQRRNAPPSLFLSLSQRKSIKTKCKPFLFERFCLVILFFFILFGFLFCFFLGIKFVKFLNSHKWGVFLPRVFGNGNFLSGLVLRGGG